MTKVIVAIICFHLSFNFAISDNFRVLHNFSGSNNDGKWPTGALLELGDFLYGMTGAGGKLDSGTIFRIKPDGSSFSLLHSFEGGDSDGSIPNGSLINSGNVLYGVTSGAYKKSFGTIFKIKVDGTDFNVLHRFSDNKNDGKYPQASLVKSGNVMYGTTTYGGESDSGTVFRINDDGKNFKILHSFKSIPNDGFYPRSALILSDSILYGVSLNGGNSYGGMIYKIDMDGSNYKILLNFPFLPNSQPWSDLVKSDSILYGVTVGGNNRGGLFKINDKGTGFTVLHTFGFDSLEGIFPGNSLVKAGDYLYGMTALGGALDTGTVYKMKTDGTEFLTIHSFTGPPDDGCRPIDNGMIFHNGYLYGLTVQGGANDFGTIFTNSPKDTCNIDSYVSINGNNQLNGDAVHNKAVIKLTSTKSYSVSSVFNNQPFDVSSGFSTSFSFHLSEGNNLLNDGSAPGADGLAFVIQAFTPNAIGGAGADIGYGGIPNSLAVEFDTYRNKFEPFSDKNGNHIAVMSNGKGPNSPNHSSAGTLGMSDMIPEIKADSTIYYSKIDYNAESKLLRIFFDTVNTCVYPVLEVPNLDLSKLLELIEGNKAFIGFTSATGTSWENTDLLSWSFCSYGNNTISGVDDHESKPVSNSIEVFPNPVTDYLHISGNDINNIEIYSILGIKVLSVEQPSPSVQQIDVSSLAPGIYYVRIGENVNKFVKI